MSLVSTKASIASFMRRNALTLAASIIAACIFAIFILQALTIASLSNQVKSQQRILGQIKQLTIAQSENAKNSSEQISGINRHMDCIVQFFSQPDRNNKSITNIDDCQLDELSQNSKANQSTTSSANQPSGNSSVSTQGLSTTASPQSPSNSDNTGDTSILNGLLNPIENLLGM